MGGLTDFKGEMCDKYKKQTNKAKDQLKNLHKKTKGPFDKTKDALKKAKDKATTPADKLNDKLSELSKKMKDKVPDLSNKSDLDEMCKACDVLQDLMSGNGSLTDAVKAVVDASKKMANKVAEDASKNLMKNVSEYAAGKAMAGMDALFGALKIPSVLGGLDKYLNCISGMCPGSNTDSIIRETNDIQKDMGFTDTGNFDSAQVMKDLDMPADKQTNLTSVESTLTKTNSDVEESATKQVEDLFASVKKTKKESVAGKISDFF